MCGRFTLTVDAATIKETFPWLDVPSQIVPRYNIAPSQPIAVIPNDGKHKIDHMLWGLIPSWARDTKRAMINARGETVAEKPTFRAAYKRRRCLILADGFYEWVKVPGGKTKTPHYIQLESKEVFGFAGLWEVWNSPDGDSMKTATIITTSPNSMMAKLHQRMPVIIHPNDYNTWLSSKPQLADRLNPLLTSYPSEEMMHYPVSRMVNSPANDTPECVVPVN